MELPDTPAINRALDRMRELGEDLEQQGWDQMSSRAETTPEGHALYWVGLWLQGVATNPERMGYTQDPSEDREMRATCHSDGTVTYWSVYRQGWTRGVPSDRELAAMPTQDRERVVRHMERHNAR